MARSGTIPMSNYKRNGKRTGGKKMYWIGILKNRRTYLIEFSGQDRRLQVYPDFPGYMIMNYEIRHYPYENIKDFIHALEQGKLKVEWKGPDAERY